MNTTSQQRMPKRTQQRMESEKKNVSPNLAELHVGDKTYHSALDVTIEVIGGKWKTLVLWNLRGGAMRFTELTKAIPDISEKMLSLQLKQLESDHVIQREVFAEVPPRVEYSLTDEGLTLLPMLEEMARWGLRKATNSTTKKHFHPRRPLTKRNPAKRAA
jgi:DNA-binding HxlR family transcriptional regulator